MFRIKNLKELREKRDNDLAVQNLKKLKEAASGTTNLMPLLIDCAKAYCTLGEMVNTLKEVFGEYEEPKFF